MKKSFVFIISMLLMMSSCSKNNDITTSTDYFKESGLIVSFDNEQFQDNVACLGGMESVDESWIRARAANMLTDSPSSARVLILDGSVIDGNIDVLSEAYENGKVIIICKPDIEKMKVMRDTSGWNFILPQDLPSSNCAIAFSKRKSMLLTPPAYIKENGEQIFQNRSVFESSRPLMQFIKRVRAGDASLTKGSVAAGGLDEKINTMTYESPNSSYMDIEIRGRYLRVFSCTNISYSVYPCYVPEGVNGNGDYYAVKAVATNYAPTMYEYADPSEGGNPEVPVGNNPYAHYWARELSYWGDCQFRGPYNTRLDVTISSGNPSDMSFTADGRPVPGTDIDTKNFSETSSFSWNVGISGSYSKKMGASIGMNAGIGGSSSNTVSYSMSDMKVVNNSDNSKVDYDYIYQNLPAYDDDFDNYESKMPSICKSTADFEMAWEWKSTVHKDNDGYIIPVVTDMTMGFSVWIRDKYTGIWRNMMYDYSISRKDTNTSLLNLARVPVGCLKINNKALSNEILYDIKVYDSLTGDAIYEGTNNVGMNEYFEVLLPQKGRSYFVSMEVGKNSYDKVTYYSYNSEITLPLALSGSDSDKRILNFVESGGDFTSKAGYLKVVNQSAVNLVRNLKVYTAGGVEVYASKSSLGFGHSLDIYLSAGVEYYVTMDFGNASSSTKYRTGSNFELPLYTKDSDIITLIANDNGGDFVED